MKKYLVVISTVGILILACSNLLPSARTPGLQAETLTPAVVYSAPAAALGGQTDLSALFESVNPGVVSIFAYLSSQQGALGTGFVVDAEGHIVTNLHVVQDSKDIEVDFPSGYKAPGSVIAEDPDSDLAVILVDAPAGELHPLTLGDSSLVKVGDPVIAIGNPYGLYNTLTLGIVSAKGRTSVSLRSAGDSGAFALADMIQTDAAINPGNSGGPLINLRGEVIGVNRSIISESVTTSGNILNSGLGFAVSSNIVRRVLPSLIANGKYDYPYLGLVAMSELRLLDQKTLNLSYSYGVYVINTVPGGPADQAGLRGGTETIPSYAVKGGGDLILAVNGIKTWGFPDLISYITLNAVPGDTVVFTILREGRTMDISVALGARP